jgi:hypothetical protein
VAFRVRLASGKTVSAWEGASCWVDGGGDDSVGNVGGAELEAAAAGARLRRRRRRRKSGGALASEGDALRRQEMLIS